MSEWNEIDDSDIRINHQHQEVEIYVGAVDRGRNTVGSIYATLTFSQIKKICESIQNSKND